MNYEKQHGIPRRRPLSSVGSQSPKLGGKSSSLPRVAGSQAINGSPSARAEINKHDAANDSCQDENVATPVKAFMSSNITPRSGARKARAETASPNTNRHSNGTPTLSRPASLYERNDSPVEDGQATSGSGLRISNAGRRSRTGSLVSDGPDSSQASGPTPSERNRSATRLTSPESIPRFFHVNDVKPVVPARPSEGSLPQSRLPGYAPTREENRANSRTSVTSNDSASDPQKGKFFYARDFQESKSPSPKVANGNNTSRPPLQTIYSAHTANSPPRAPSPLKDEVLPQTPTIHKASPRRHTRLISNGGGELKSPEAISVSNGDLSRRSSLNAPRNSRFSGHARSQSVQSTGRSSSRRSSIALSDTSPIERVRNTSLVGANGALPHSVNPPSTTQELADHQVPSQPQSPTKSLVGGQSKIEQMNELAAKARRERKVLDLEISNSSLLAINRTLEREMRKQNAELRRYRRLSRSGRISIAPSSRSASGKMSVLPETDTNIESDDVISSTDGEDDYPDLKSNLSSTSATSRPSSPIGRAARARFQDPTRVELDLSAHRALLVDAQKLNLSIKRCLSHSESLISSGKQALEYRARTPEPENLGPRVLTPEDITDEVLSHGQGLLSPSLDQDIRNPWERSLGSAGSLDDGLETPDYSQWGSPTAGQTPFAETVVPANSSLTDGAGIKDMDQTAQDPETQLEDEGLADVDDEEARRISIVASIDGLDDDSDTESKSPVHERPVLTTQGTNPDSYAARAERKQNIKAPDPQPGQPGYRGSMQNLGHYLQAFSIFGAPQQT